MKRICFVAPLIILAACATPTLRTPTTGSLEVAREAALQRKFVIEKQRDQWITLTRVMYRLSTAAADLCGVKVSGAVGMAMMTAKEFPGEYEAVARSEFGFDNGFTVVAVMPDSPAQGGGLEAGDRIISVDGTAIAASPADSKVLQASLKRDAAAQTPLTMVIRRNGVDETLKITPDRVCDYQAGISNDNEINAFADGSRVVATKGLMNFVKSDEELALVLSHEISHNVLDHIGKQRKNAALGGAAGLIADVLVAAATGVNPGLYRTGEALGRMAYSVEFEKEADYQGLYIMRRAGYPLDGAGDFWRRMAAEDPKQITLRRTHPTSPERFVAIGNTVTEISSKEAQGVALAPNMQKGQPMTQIARAPELPAPSIQPAFRPTAAQPMQASLVPNANNGRSSMRESVPVAKPKLGIRGGTVERGESGPSAYLPDPYGAWIDDVMPGGPAARAGLKRADIVRTFNGHRVSTFDELEAYAAETIPGTTVQLGVFRNRQMIVVPVGL